MSERPVIDLNAPVASRSDSRFWPIAWVVIVCCLGIVGGRIATCKSLERNAPFFSANDASRWCTIKSLVDYQTYEIDEVHRSARSLDGIPVNWNTIDMVQHVGSDGAMRHYSSKPPFLPTLLAGQYWLIEKITGKNLDTNLFLVARTIIAVTNFACLIILLVSLGKLTCVLTDDLWTQVFVIAAGAFGTSLTTFAITISNHLPAAAATMLTLYALVRIWRDDAKTIHYAIAGLGSAFAAANELPALSLVAFAVFVAIVKSPSRFFVGFLLPFAIVTAGFFGTNFLAHGSWRPPYAHRNDGAVICSVDGDFESQLNSGQLPVALRSEINKQLTGSGRELLVTTVSEGRYKLAEGVSGRWIISPGEPGQLVVLRPDGSNEFQVRRWDNWYEYEGSYWLSTNDNKSLVDQGEPDPNKYMFHCLVGHHGIFSLTPIWLLSIFGLILLIVGRKYKVGFVAISTLAISIVVVAFYFNRPVYDRNYGGFTSALRWLFWLYPFWLMWMIPAVEHVFAGRFSKWLAIAMLGLSVASATYAASNPWTHPWLYQFLAN